MWQGSARVLDLACISQATSCGCGALENREGVSCLLDETVLLSLTVVFVLPVLLPSWGATQHKPYLSFGNFTKWLATHKSCMLAPNCNADAH